MELAAGVYGLPLDVSLGDRELTLNPVAVEPPRGLLLPDVGLPDGLEDLAAALDGEGLALEDTWVVVIHQDLDHAGRLAAVVDRTEAVVVTHEAAAPYLEEENALVKPTDGDRGDDGRRPTDRWGDVRDCRGLVGCNTGTVCGSEARGSVSGDTTVGDLVGGGDGTVTDTCPPYATPTPTD
jgi:glyoxylase-like metal-dependent hydrolase (beta-lactamase superfamily II)